MKKSNKVVVEVRGSLNHYRLVATEHTGKKTSAGFPLKFRWGFDKKYRTKALANKAAKELRAFIRSGGDWKSLETAQRFNPRKRKNSNHDRYRITFNKQKMQAFVNTMFENGQDDILVLLNDSMVKSSVRNYYVIEISESEAKDMMKAIKSVRNMITKNAERNRQGRLSKIESHELNLIDDVFHQIDSSLVARQRKRKNPSNVSHNFSLTLLERKLLKLLVRDIKKLNKHHQISIPTKKIEQLISLPKSGDKSFSYSITKSQAKAIYEELQYINSLGTIQPNIQGAVNRVMKKLEKQFDSHRRNPSKGAVLELNQTTIKALNNYFTGRALQSPMAYLAENAKKKSPRSKVFIFEPTPTFLEVLRLELQRVLAYSTIKTDRDFTALKKLLMQTYKVRFNPRKKTSYKKAFNDSITYKQAMDSIKKHLRSKGWSISGDYGQKGDFVLVFKRKEIRFGRNYGNKKDNIANAGYPLVGYLIIQDIRKMSMSELDKEIADAERLFNRPSF